LPSRSSAPERECNPRLVDGVRLRAQRARDKDMGVVVALNTGEVIGILRIYPW
jgi:hypothetical protein